MRRNLVVLSVFFLGGCDLSVPIKRIGDHMPTIGDRCESAECITPSGKAASDAIKARKAKSEQGPQQPVKPAPADPKPAPTDPYDTTEPF